MGFRDLRGFNTMFLAKQLWSLHHRPHSLVARMIQAKYHKNGTTLDSTLGYRPSFMWRSLLSAQEVLWSGLMWQVGNEAIQIWIERWVPSIVEGFIPSAPIEVAVDATVTELVDPNTNQWNHALLERCVSPTIVHVIHQIPLRDIGETYRIIWHSSMNDRYSTKDGYHWWLNKFKILHGISLAWPHETWKSLWSLQIPPKVKFFMWKFVKNILPMAFQVSKRNNHYGNSCAVCGLE
ncbi:Uncharacterized mitochondrial protein AtMg00310 [Linum grandiflorum]